LKLIENNSGVAFAQAIALQMQPVAVAQQPAN
jgi:hypothetical protein